MGEDFLILYVAIGPYFFSVFVSIIGFFSGFDFYKMVSLFWEVHDRVPNVFQVSAQFAQSHTTSLQNNFSYFPLE